MTIEKIPFSQVPQFSSRDVAYTDGDVRLRSFYKYDVNLESFRQVILDKSTQHFEREILVKTLMRQYKNLGCALNEKVHHNIELLKNEHTFTVITAHQPSLFTGPLYYIYKIISTINLAKTLSETYPTYNIIPVFITGGEDHDFEEVQKAHIFNKALVWENEESGSVGSMNTSSLTNVLNDLKEVLGESPNAAHIYNIIEDAYTQNTNYADATIQLVDSLFGKEGLVVINMNNADLKRLFIPIIKDELENQTSYKLVSEVGNDLSKIDFKPQANPREINLFYLRDQIRERIVYDEGLYRVLNTDYTFDKESLLQEVEQHPEYFSPNVILRPLYQECVLPNLAYIGGGGELAYWLERKTQFEHYNINFPMLIRRNSALWIDKGMAKRIQKLNLTIHDIFADTESLIKDYLKNNSENTLSLNQQKEEVTKIFDTIAEIAHNIDPTLKAKVLAESAKQQKVISQLEGRLIKAEKQKYDTTINQIRGIKDKLFFNNGLQERRDNFINFYLKYGESFFETLKTHLHPLDKRLVVITDD